jgi:hypothetical protein
VATSNPYGQERRASRQSTGEGQNDRNCGASRKVSARSAAPKRQSARVRHQATANGKASTSSGASAAGAALYQRRLAKVTEPSSQLRPTRRGITVSPVGRAPVSNPAKKWAAPRASNKLMDKLSA